LSEFDASGFYVFTKTGTVKTGRQSALLFYRKTRKIDWLAKDLEKRFPPDAIFYRGVWYRGRELFAK